MYYGDGDDEFLGGVDYRQMQLLMDKEIKLSSMQQHSIEQLILLYLISRDMWRFIKDTACARCMSCHNPHYADNFNHICIYLQCLYFVSAPTKLKDIINDLYEESVLNIDWNRIKQEWTTLSMRPCMLKLCSDNYWRTRGRSVEFETFMKPLLFQISRQNGYFDIVSQMMTVLGWKIPPIYK